MSPTLAPVFVGVVAVVFLGFNGVRVPAAGAPGLFPNATVVAASATAVPAAAGVAADKRLRGCATERRRRTAVLAPLTVIGVRLVLGGLGVV